MHIKIIFLLLIVHIYGINALAQKHNIHTYLPEITYDQDIPTPSAYLGFDIGEWHITPDQAIGYLSLLAQKSDKIEVHTIGYTHEKKPLTVAFISNSKHISNKDKIKQNQQKLTFGKLSKSEMNAHPNIIWQGYTIHGNEPSGLNASLVVAYYLVAGQSEYHKQLLDQCFFIIDPCLNPDGSMRFATWVNSHKSVYSDGDPNTRELNEAYPRGRYNHYWFDLNRDWLPLVHPESKARINLFHEWRPNILTDHHEMGTNSTFFFQPGVPSSSNPNTPNLNQIITKEIAEYHARALDSVGSLYYSQYRFDDFYYGKGSTYPDALGCIGILFEQASSRGHIQQSVHGPITFAFTIKNQVIASLSTQAAGLYLKNRIQQYKSEFYTNILKEISKESTKAYVFTHKDPLLLQKFLSLLDMHRVEYHALSSDLNIHNTVYPSSSSFVVSILQKEPILAKTIFENTLTYQDSIFYDVSAWNIAAAYGLQHHALTTVPAWSNSIQNNTVSLQKLSDVDSKTYAYIVPSGQLGIHSTLYYLQQKGIRVKLVDEPLSLIEKGNESIPRGSLLVYAHNNSLPYVDIHKHLNHAISLFSVKVIPLLGGNGTQAVTIGHPKHKPLEKKKTAFLIGGNISPTSAGEVWWQLDNQLHMPATMIDIENSDRIDWDDYNTLILPSGRLSQIKEATIDKIKDWVKKGNTLISIEDASHWLIQKKIISLNDKKDVEAQQIIKNYADIERKEGAQQIGGSIFKAKIDTTHPLLYGVYGTHVACMKTDTRAYSLPPNKLASPMYFEDDFLLSGYIPQSMSKLFSETPALTTHAMGNGTIIAFHYNPLFRGYWLNGQCIFNNALFWGNILDRSSLD